MNPTLKRKHEMRIDVAELIAISILDNDTHKHSEFVFISRTD